MLKHVINRVFVWQKGACIVVWPSNNVSGLWPLEVSPGSRQPRQSTEREVVFLFVFFITFFLQVHSSRKEEKGANESKKVA